jgi:hypothetical protein
MNKRLAYCDQPPSIFRGHLAHGVDNLLDEAFICGRLFFRKSRGKSFLIFWSFRRACKAGFPLFRKEAEISERGQLEHFCNLAQPFFPRLGRA